MPLEQALAKYPTVEALASLRCRGDQAHKYQIHTNPTHITGAMRCGLGKPGECGAAASGGNGKRHTRVARQKQNARQHIASSTSSGRTNGKAVTHCSKPKNGMNSNVGKGVAKGTKLVALDPLRNGSDSYAKPTPSSVSMTGKQQQQHVSPQGPDCHQPSNPPCTSSLMT